MENACDIPDLFDRGFYNDLIQKIVHRISNNTFVKHFEVYCSSVQNLSVKFEKGAIKKAIQKNAGGVGLRVIDATGREGMTFTSDFSDSALEIIMQSAVHMMKAATENPDFKNLAEPSKNYTPVSGIYDPAIETVCPEDINDLLQPIFGLKHRSNAPKSLSGGFSSTLGASYVWNSNGIDLWDISSTVSCSAEVGVARSGVSSSGFNWQSVCNLKELNVEQIATRSYAMAEHGLSRQSVETGEYPIILSPLATAYFLIDPITTAIQAERVQNDMSFLAGKVDSPIGSEHFSLNDNPHLPGKLGTESFDAEGIATRPMQILDRGVLKDLYHNTLTAGKVTPPITSNGHASRGGYSGNIGISNNNLIMDEGNRSWKDMVADIKQGIFMEYSGDSPNYITGDFSGLIMTGYLIEDGEIGPAVVETLLGINLLDAFQRVEEVSQERVWIDEALMPYVKLSHASISSRL
ncbi:MAG: TldD/PmbA family protein [Promethearchaeota archaeon]